MARVRLSKYIRYFTENRRVAQSLSGGIFPPVKGGFLGDHAGGDSPHGGVDALHEKKLFALRHFGDMDCPARHERFFMALATVFFLLFAGSNPQSFAVVTDLDHAAIRTFRELDLLISSSPLQIP